MTTPTRSAAPTASILCALLCAWAVGMAFAGLATARGLSATECPRAAAVAAAQLSE